MANDAQNSVTDNYNFLLMGDEHQLSARPYRENIQDIGRILETTLQNAKDSALLVDNISMLTAKKYNQLTYETGALYRNLYFIKEEG